MTMIVMIKIMMMIMMNVTNTILKLMMNENEDDDANVEKSFLLIRTFRSPLLHPSQAFAQRPLF